MWQDFQPLNQTGIAGVDLGSTDSTSKYGGPFKAVSATNGFETVVTHHHSRHPLRWTAHQKAQGAQLMPKLYETGVTYDRAGTYDRQIAAYHYQSYPTSSKIDRKCIHG